ncbi:MAG: SUMF1/EgtB/PvdO family nonheme iron enzyme, partial [Candidatus Firestonebacteria bacterium]
MKVKICPNCKTENRKEANFCKGCRLDLTKVMLEKVKGEKKIKKDFFVKSLIGLLAVVLTVFIGWYVYMNLMADKSKTAIREMIEIEKEISLLDNEITKGYAENEIDQARRFLQESKDAHKRNDSVSSIEWLKQAKETVNQAKEKDRAGRKKDYDLNMSKGKENVDKGLWDEAISSYKSALKYKMDDKEASTGIKSVQMKKQEELDRKELAEKKRKEEERKQKINSYISNGKKYMDGGKYSGAVLEFEKAKELGAEGVEKLLSEAKKMTEGTGKYAGMIYILAGEFEMGSNDYGDEKPVHKVYLDAYYIDKYEVTFEQYDKFCEATKRE